MTECCSADRRSTRSTARTQVKALALAVALAGVVACGDSTTGPPAGDIGWESVTLRSNSGSVLVEDVTYRSDGLLISGRVCRPNRGGTNAALIWNHGGFVGLSAGDDGICDAFARLGYAVFMSSYRGEDDSQGNVEVCLGEVDDVLVITEIASQQRYVNSSRIVMAGASHGGCITLRALQRGAPAHAAVALSAPTDWSALHGQYADSAAAGSVGRRSYYQGLIDEMEGYFGGTPAQRPDAYASRSPATFAGALGAWNRPLLLVHGTADDLVFPVQACIAASTAGASFTAMFVQPDGSVTAGAPPACSGLALEWSAGPRPGPQWPGSRYLLAYQGVGHELGGAAGAMAADDAVSFLRAKTP